MTEVYISDNVPVIDRALILSHEIREKSRFRLLPAEERCTAALAAELSEVQLTRKPQDYKKYVERRMDYFNAALRHYQRTAMETPQFMDGLLTATTYINHIAAGLGKKPKR